MKQRGEPRFFIIVQRGPFVQSNAQTPPTISAKSFGQFTRIGQGICQSCFLGELNSESRRERPLWKKRRAVRLDKRTPAFFEILRM